VTDEGGEQASLDQLVLDDLRWNHEALTKRAEQSDTLAAGLLTASVAVGALIASALKDVALPLASVILVALAAASLVLTALMAAAVRIESSWWAGGLGLRPLRRLFARLLRAGVPGAAGQIVQPLVDSALDLAYTRFLEQNPTRLASMQEALELWQTRVRGAASTALRKAFLVTLALGCLLLATLFFGLALLVRVSS
jgi:hypothetical protein